MAPTGHVSGARARGGAQTLPLRSSSVRVFVASRLRVRHASHCSACCLAAAQAALQAPSARRRRGVPPAAMSRFGWGVRDDAEPLTTGYDPRTGVVRALPRGAHASRRAARSSEAARTTWELPCTTARTAVPRVRCCCTGGFLTRVLPLAGAARTSPRAASQGGGVCCSPARSRLLVPRGGPRARRAGHRQRHGAVCAGRADVHAGATPLPPAQPLSLSGLVSCRATASPARHWLAAAAAPQQALTLLTR